MVNPNGNPVADVNVQIKQTKHRFAFGTCISSTQMSNDSYKNFIADHFEWTACENESKWIWNEWSQDVENYDAADNIYNWCNGFDFNRDGSVLLDDLKTFTDGWLSGIE